MSDGPSAIVRAEAVEAKEQSCFPAMVGDEVEKREIGMELALDLGVVVVA